ncbi:hypothetical protein ACE6ED_01965 [Paenibacillus sp. CN-4]|uniref:hypothetical protein n=1 Tax=Paenibacillus nanchangensis TaxID=3348343 RepID=UPI00397E0CE4
MKIYNHDRKLKKEQRSTKKHKDPRREKLRDFRKGIKSVHYNKEGTTFRRWDYRRYRTRMKQLMREQKYELLRQYQKTSGWNTW